MEIIDAVILKNKIESYRQKFFIISQNSRDCIRNFLELFGNNYGDILKVIVNILKQRFDYQGNIVTGYSTCCPDIEIQKFESYLLSDSQNKPTNDNS